MPTIFGGGWSWPWTANRGAAGGGAPAFTPASLGASLLQWHDASDSATFTVNADGTGGTPTAGQAVGRWMDKSGNARHLQAPAANMRPVRTAAAQNGLDVLAFDGVDDKLITTDFGTTETHYLMVARHAGTMGGLFGRTIGGAYDWLYKPTGDTVLANFGAPRGGSGVQLNNAGVWPGTGVYSLFCLSIVPGIAGTTNVDLSRDGVSYASSTLAIGSTVWFAPVGLGSTEVANTGNHATCMFGAFLMLGVVTGTQLAQTKAYLKAQWGTP